MLIDVTRRPVRLNYEECPSVTVIRTMGIRGMGNGLICQDHSRSLKTLYVATPVAKMMHGTQEYMETILRVPVKLSHNQLRRQERTPYDADTREWRRVQVVTEVEPLSDEPYYVVTGFQNQANDTAGVCRIHFIFDPGPKEGLRLLTLFDETHGVMLFTVIIPEDSGRSIFKVVTPLQRAVRNQINGNHSGGLWAALAEDDDGENP